MADKAGKEARADQEALAVKAVLVVIWAIMDQTTAVTTEKVVMVAVVEMEDLEAKAERVLMVREKACIN